MAQQNQKAIVTTIISTTTVTGLDTVTTTTSFTPFKSSTLNAITTIFLLLLLHLPLQTHCFVVLPFYQSQPTTKTTTLSLSETPASFVRSIILEEYPPNNNNKNNNNNSNQKKQQQQQRDYTTIPSQALLLPTTTTDDENENKDEDTIPLLLYSSNLIPKQAISTKSYMDTTTQQHKDCLTLFGSDDNNNNFNYYRTNITRCQVIDDTKINLSWIAEWIPSSSSWLYVFSNNVMKWNVTQRELMYEDITTFSWKRVFLVFYNAFTTGEITLPVIRVEGNTILTCDWWEYSTRKNNKEEEEKEKEQTTTTTTSSSSSSTTIPKKRGYCKSIQENINLVNEADKNRLVNRRVAQELAAWLDVSRRPFSETSPPPDYTNNNNNNDDNNNNKEWWSDIIQERILTGVPGAGPLDIDPNENEDEGEIAVLSFGLICVISLVLTYHVFVETAAAAECCWVI